MSSAYELQYHPEIGDDMFDIFTLIEGYAGSEVAHRKLNDIERTMKGLTDFPHNGSLREDFGQNIRAIPAGKKGVICFSVNEKERVFFILPVTYAGADWMSRIASRL